MFNYNNNKNKNEEDKELLTLSLSSTPLPPPQQQPTMTPPTLPQQPKPPRRSRMRLRAGKVETVPAPFPWATTQRATVYSMSHLLSKNITVISGKVECKKCDKQYDIEYNLKDSFIEVSSFIRKNKIALHQRAPQVWMNPDLPTCKICQQNNVKPVTEKKKRKNWLFLLLGQMLGCCTLKELKYFCKHTSNHRTGAKDRLLYLTYLGLCKQLDPKGPFDP